VGLEMSKLAGAQLLISGGLTWLELIGLVLFPLPAQQFLSGSFGGIIDLPSSNSDEFPLRPILYSKTSTCL
jgi:hypothetical protein